jgi:hypothetical protein
MAESKDEGRIGPEAFLRVTLCTPWLRLFRGRQNR